MGCSQFLLAERTVGDSCYGTWIHTKHTTLVREEVPLAGHTGGHWIGVYGVLPCCEYIGERVSALRGRVVAEHVVNQVRGR